MKKLLFTGGTGFLGKNARPVLEKVYTVTTCGISQDDDIKANLAQSIPELPEKYDVVLHACGKAHIVPRTEAEIQAFYDVNYHGTVNLCAALENVGIPKSLIFISTVAVYGLERGENISEDIPLKGTSPYAKSKIMAEEFLTEWCEKKDVVLTILRPSLLAGHNAPGNLGAMCRGIQTGHYLSIAGGKARKSVLMAQDIANLVILAEDKGGVYNVCDDRQPTFRQLEEVISRQLGKKTPISIPYWFAKCCAVVGDCLGAHAPINSMKLIKMTKSLTFSNVRAKSVLDWTPLDVLTEYKI